MKGNIHLFVSGNQFKKLFKAVRQTKTNHWSKVIMTSKDYLILDLKVFIGGKPEESHRLFHSQCFAKNTGSSEVCLKFIQQKTLENINDQQVS
jgi:hypothetical protein